MAEAGKVAAVAETARAVDKARKEAEESSRRKQEEHQRH